MASRASRARALSPQIRANGWRFARRKSPKIFPFGPPAALFEQRRPGRVRGESGSRDEPLVAPRQIHHIELRPSVLAGSIPEEHEHPSVRRPCRSFIVETFG